MVCSSFLGDLEEFKMGRPPRVGEGVPTRGGVLHAWGGGSLRRGEGVPHEKNGSKVPKSLFFLTHFDQNPLTPEVPPNTPPRGRPPIPYAW